MESAPINSGEASTRSINKVGRTEKEEGAKPWLLQLIQSFFKMLVRYIKGTSASGEGSKVATVSGSEKIDFSDQDLVQDYDTPICGKKLAQLVEKKQLKQDEEKVLVHRKTLQKILKDNETCRKFSFKVPLGLIANAKGMLDQEGNQEWFEFDACDLGRLANHAFKGFSEDDDELNVYVEHSAAAWMDQFSAAK